MTELPTPAVACARYRVIHETHYEYESSVTLSQQFLHVTPRDFAHQTTSSHHIVVEPQEEDGVTGTDFFGNCTRHVAITTPHKRLVVRAQSTVALTARPGLAQIKGSLPWEQLRARMLLDRSAATLDACRYLYASPHVNCSPELEAYARLSYTAGRAQLDAALNLTQRIYKDFEFDAKAT